MQNNTTKELNFELFNKDLKKLNTIKYDSNNGNGNWDRFIFKNVLTKIVANSIETKKTILKNLNSVIDSNKIDVVYHGIETEQYSLTNSSKNEFINKYAKGLIIGNAGRLTNQKGQKYLIDIAKELKNRKISFTIFIAGTGELESILQEEILKNDLSQQIYLMGFVDEMDSFMNSIDIFVLTSIWEGFGYVLTEALLKQKPVVCFNTSSNPEIIKENHNGFLVDFPNIYEFANRIELLANDVSLKTKMGENGLKDVKLRFNFSNQVTKFEQCIITNSIKN